MVKRNSAVFVIMALTILSCMPEISLAQLQGTIKDVEQSVGTMGNVNWTTGEITAVGVGAPPAQPSSTAEGRTVAERTAQAVAYRNMLEVVKGVRIDSMTTVQNDLTSSNRIRSEVDGIIQGATIMDKKYMVDGSVEVTLGMMLTGAFADTLLPKTSSNDLTSALASVVPGQLYTGLIVDARGLGVKPAMAPKILNEDGKEIYGSAWVSRDYAVREGMVSYLNEPLQAQANPRVADKPLMVKALKAKGDASVDVVITNADSAILQSSSENLSMLKKCRVIILVD
jgi:hypothetical protein